MSCYHSIMMFTALKSLWRLDDNEYVPPDLHASIRLLKTFGIWAPKEKSALYDWYSIMMMIVFGIPFPVSQIMNVFYANSVHEFAKYIFIPVTGSNGTIKAILIQQQQRKIRQILELHRKMHADGQRFDTENIYPQTTKMNQRILQVSEPIDNFSSTCEYSVLLL